MNAAAEKPTRMVCPICPHQCTLTEGQFGICRARKAQNGAVVDDNYGRVTAMSLDPIEKKPLARFHRGSMILSVGSYGCNLRCGFCQNADIAVSEASDVNWRFVSPDALVAEALKLRSQGNIGIAYTYNEPLIGYEYVLRTAQMAHEQGLLNVIVTNGMVNPGPLEKLLPHIDAANVDLKGFTQAFYSQLGGDLATVKATIEAIAACPTCHLEVTTLVIPDLNDDPAEVEAAAKWLASLSPRIPYHLSRFFPHHRMINASPTPVKEINNLVALAHRHLRFVYPGNC